MAAAGVLHSSHLPQIWANPSYLSTREDQPMCIEISRSRPLRRHIMIDIGKARRKPARNAKVPIHLPSHANDAEEDDDDEKHTSVDLQAPFWDQQPLTVLERQWEMDMFSAYGIILMMRESRALATKSMNTFWFPFALKSQFIREHQDIFSDRNILANLHMESTAKFEHLALARASGTIACIESRLASHDSCIATSNAVISGVSAIICYNV